MAQLAIGKGRFVEVPDEAGLCNRFALSYDDQASQMGIIFLWDDGVSASHLASVAIPKERIAALAAAVVQVAKHVGVDWQDVDTKRLPPTDDSVH